MLGQQTLVVGAFPPNNFELHAMADNVWEWTEDYVTPITMARPAMARRGPPAVTAHAMSPVTRHVTRGGSWDNAPHATSFGVTVDFLGSAYRTWRTSDSRLDSVGFRIARTLFAP